MSGPVGTSSATSLSSVLFACFVCGCVSDSMFYVCVSYSRCSLPHNSRVILRDDMVSCMHSFSDNIIREWRERSDYARKFHSGESPVR